MGVCLLDLKQVEPVTKLVKLKVSFKSDKCLDESEVGLKVFIFESPAGSKLYLFKALLSVTEISSETQFSRSLEDSKRIRYITFS